MEKKRARTRIDTIGRHLIDSTTRDGDSSSSSFTATTSTIQKSGYVEKELDGGWQGVDPSKIDIRKKKMLHPLVRGRILEFFDQIEDIRALGGVNLSDVLPGPTRDRKRYDHVKELLREIQHADNNGYNHTYWESIQDRYCNGDRTANIVIPVISFVRGNVRPPILTNKIILSHPDDCRRIARAHVQKMPDQTLFLHSGVLSQIDNERWMRQRGHLNEAFLPLQSLRRLFPLSLRRATESAEGLLSGLSRGSGVVQMNEFLLNETMAQLLLLLFGLPKQVVEKYNKRVRDAFAYLLEVTGGTGGGAAENMDVTKVQQSAGQIFAFASKILKNAPTTRGVAELLGSNDGEESVRDDKMLRGCPGIDGILGPLSARINDMDTANDGKRRSALEERVFNAATFVFAGHDTTANTMSWLLFEMSQIPSVQERLQREVDALASHLAREGRDLEYRDLKRLEFMTKCIAETLRLWPVVPNGTFRELQFDDTVRGPPPDYRPVRVPKGTFVQIANWMRHRSSALWGDDAEVFNPDREWRENELWGASHFPLGGFNPSSDRYSPFTYAPRDCMGKNFAQMEMRVILFTLIRRFHFDLAPPTSAFDRKTFKGINRATLGPRNIGRDPSLPAELGLYMRVTARVS